MKDYLRHIGIYLLTAFVLVASTGISFCCLFCYCKSEVEASIVKQDDTFTTFEKQNCCQGKACKLPASEKNHDCSDCSSTYVNLDVDYLLPNFDFKINLPFVQKADYQTFEIPLLATSKTINWENDLPPPSGMELRVLLESFLC